MTKLLEQAIAKVRVLPDEEQDTLAALMLSMAGSDASVFPIDGETEAAIREGIAQPSEASSSRTRSWRRPTSAMDMKVRYTPRAFADREAIAFQCHSAASRGAIGGGIQSAAMPRSARITWAAL
jgi:hypothetical protein